MDNLIGSANHRTPAASTPTTGHMARTQWLAMAPRRWRLWPDGCLLFAVILIPFFME